MDTMEEPENNIVARVIIAVVVVAVIAGVGAIGQFAGTGWFSYRQVLYGTGEIYLLNLGDEPLRVKVDGREGVEVPARDARLAELIGGQSEVVVLEESGEEIARYEVRTDESHAFLKLTEEGCAVISDIGSFYGQGGGDEIEFVEQVRPSGRLYVLESKNVIWPRKKFPPTLRSSEGPGIWVEQVACSLLEEPEFLRAYLRVRLVDRMGADEKPPERRGAPGGQ